jgi:hypothetical protein
MPSKTVSHGLFIKLNIKEDILHYIAFPVTLPLLDNSIIGIDENEDFQLKGPINIFNKIIEINFPKERDDHEHIRSLKNSK